MLKRNSINVHSHTRPLVKSRELAGLEFIFEKSKHWEAGLKHKLKDSGFLETL